MHSSRSHYHVRNIGEPPEIVGWVSKDDIKLFMTDLQPVAHVNAVNPCMFRTEVTQGFADECAAAPVSLHNINIRGSRDANSKLIAPVPPKRSSRETAEKSYLLFRIFISPSRAKSVVGLATKPDGGSISLPCICRQLFARGRSKEVQPPMHAHLVHDIAEALPDEWRGELYTGRKVQERQCVSL